MRRVDLSKKYLNRIIVDEKLSLTQRTSFHRITKGEIILYEFLLIRKKFQFPPAFNNCRNGTC